MSWISFVPPGVNIPEDKLKNAWAKSPDGGGVAYAKDGKITVSKGFLSFDNFIEAYKVIPIDSSRLIFFRYSYINRTEENCQPIFINENLVFAHSGIVTGFTATGKNDSVVFNEKILQPYLEKDYKKVYNEDNQWIMAESIGSYSPLVFLTKDGKASILNANRGEWDKVHEGLWYSNKDHEFPVRPLVTYNPQTQTWAPKPKTENTEPYLTWLRKCYFDAKLQLENEAKFAV